MNRIPATIIGGLALLFAGGSAQADTLTMFGASSRATAMGGAMVAIAEGSEATFYNVSALALSPESSSLGYNMLQSRLEVNGTDYGPGDGPKPFLGANWRLLRDRVGLGLLVDAGGLIGGGGGGGGGIAIPGLGGGGGYGWSQYGSSTIPLTYGFGIRLHDTLGVGFGTATNVKVQVSEFTLVVDSILESLLGISVGVPVPDINTNVGIGLVTEPGPPSVNLTFRPLKYVSFGYVRKPSNWMRLQLPIVITSGGLLDDDIRMVIISPLSQSPEMEQMGVGVHLPLPRSTLTLSWEQDRQLWEDLRDDLEDEYLRYTQPDIADLIQVSFSRMDPVHNVTIYRYGMEYELEAGFLPTQFLKSRAPKLAVRGGYFHWDSPLPDGQLWGRSFDSDADVYSGGLGLVLDRKGRKALQDPSVPRQLQVDLHAQYIALEERNFKLRYDDWGNVRGGSTEYYYHTEGEILNLGMQVTWRH